MDWTRVLAESRAHSCRYISVFVAFLTLAVALIVCGIIQKNLLINLAGVVSACFALAINQLLYRSLLSNRFLVVVVSTDWHPQSKSKLRELLLKHEKRLTWRHYREISKIQQQEEHVEACNYAEQELEASLERLFK